MHRRLWISAALLAVAGCSSGRKSSSRSGKSAQAKPAPQTRKLPGSPDTAGPRKGRPKDRKFDNLTVDMWIADLESGSPKNRALAATELGNMGSGAKHAIPKLEKLTKDPNAEVAAAAKKAITSIRK